MSGKSTGRFNRHWRARRDIRHAKDAPDPRPKTPETLSTLPIAAAEGEAQMSKCRICRAALRRKVNRKIGLCPRHTRQKAEIARLVIRRRA